MSYRTDNGTVRVTKLAPNLWEFLTVDIDGNAVSTVQLGGLRALALIAALESGDWSTASR